MSGFAETDLWILGWMPFLFQCYRAKSFEGNPEGCVFVL